MERIIRQTWRFRYTMRVTEATKLRLPARNTVETVVLLSNEKSKPDSCIDLTVDVSDIRRLAAGESLDG